ncbi:nuclease-related domain-containing protein [Gracilibacillus sp. HCP3S3_G5_1]|uniref:nuclease-related domain-containing protein n=1 Tax=unclassified Gracilibacillus TaxID=2625209 RepID=UPI003F8B6B3B
MIIKVLKKPYELEVFDALDSRITFTQKEMVYYHNLKQGYEGEKNFEQLLRDTLVGSFLVISDIRMEIGTTFFQIDSILLTGDTLYLFDVKNYPGDYMHAEKRWYKLPKKEINNPLLQLKRNETLMRQVLQELQVNVQMECYDVFINSEFTLYQAPINKQLIFPSQIAKFIKDLRSQTPVTSSQHKLAKQLIARDTGNYPYPRIPTYEYQQLKKGLRCVNCNSISVNLRGRNCFCSTCGHVDAIHKAFLRNIDELRLLFSDQKLTTNLVYDWCGKEYSKKSIQRLLERNFQKNGVRQWTYYG